jgi:hypothetical protein
MILLDAKAKYEHILVETADIDKWDSPLTGT